jgi:hypothetical protein
MASMTLTPSQNGVIVVLKQDADAGNEVLTFNSRTAFYRFLDARIQWQKRVRNVSVKSDMPMQGTTAV